MGERIIGQPMRHDFSVGTEAFRDSLLARCFGIIDSRNAFMAIDDSEFELLAAAGTPFEPGTPLP